MSTAWQRMTEEQREALCKWVFDACRIFGSSLATAHLVAGAFADGLDREGTQ